jgi:hypothetical protein
MHGEPGSEMRPRSAAQGRQHARLQLRGCGQRGTYQARRTPVPRSFPKSRFGLPCLPAMLAMLTIRPQPLSRIPGMTARHRLNTPFTLTEKVRCHSASVLYQNGLFGPNNPGAIDEDVDRPDLSDGRVDSGRIADVELIVAACCQVERDHFNTLSFQSVHARGSDSALGTGDNPLLHYRLPLDRAPSFGAPSTRAATACSRTGLQS